MLKIKILVLINFGHNFNMQNINFRFCVYILQINMLTFTPFFLLYLWIYTTFKGFIIYSNSSMNNSVLFAITALKLIGFWLWLIRLSRILIFSPVKEPKWNPSFYLNISTNINCKNSFSYFFFHCAIVCY